LEAMQHQDMDAALQAGSRTLVYFVQAEAWDRLGDLASKVVTSTSHLRQLEELIPHLRTAAEFVPEGRARWTCMGNLAKALARSGRPETSLPFYEQAANLARAVAETDGHGATQAWADLAVATSDYASALCALGNLDAAHLLQLESAAMAKKAGRPPVEIIGCELEALRIEIMQGRVLEALPQVQAKLEQVEGWWQRQRAGLIVTEAPDLEPLSRTYIGALYLANQGHREMRDWATALRYSDAILAVERELQRTSQEIASTRMHRANELGALKRFAEARAELESCLQIFEGDPYGAFKVHGSFAALFHAQGDYLQAVNQQRRALAFGEWLPDPADRVRSHNNMASYLERQGTPSSIAESSRHELASLTYCLGAQLGRDIQFVLRNYGFTFRRARAAVSELVIPRLAQLLADPAFHPLDLWLRQNHVDLNELQAAIDKFIDQARQASLE
jgi:tetratricopeptide (TPR) repeat protein